MIEVGCDAWNCTANDDASASKMNHPTMILHCRKAVGKLFFCTKNAFWIIASCPDLTCMLETSIYFEFPFQPFFLSKLKASPSKAGWFWCSGGWDSVRPEVVGPRAHSWPKVMAYKIWRFIKIWVVLSHMIYRHPCLVDDCISYIWIVCILCLL